MGTTQTLTTYLQNHIDFTEVHWLWTGALRKGYGRLWLTGYRKRSAHRVVWEYFYGPIPVGKVVDHQCRTRNCVNPAHLRLASWRQNAIENSRGPSAIHAAKVVCHKGHELANVVECGLSRRRCTICAKITKHEWYLRNRERRKRQ